MPEKAGGAKRLLVPEILWLFIYEDAMKVKPDDLLGCSTFPLDSEECPECSDALSEVACLEDSIRSFKKSSYFNYLAVILTYLPDFRYLWGRARKLKERQNHEKLALGKSIPLSLDCKYYLLPSTWLTKWRNYISASGKNASSIEPEILDGVIDSLKCEKVSCHLRLPVLL